MVGFKPFAGFRPNLSNGGHDIDRISPPHDASGDSDGFKSLPYNVSNLLAADADKRYNGARALLDEWIAGNALKQDGDTFYLYEQTAGDDVRLAFVGALNVEKYDQGNVVPMGDTPSKTKADRLNLMNDLGGCVEPVVGLFEGFSPELSKAVDAGARLIYFCEDGSGTVHKFYRIGDAESVAAVEKEFAEKRILIVGGQQWYDAALSDGKERSVLAALIPSQDAVASCRLVDTGNISEKNAVKGISKAMATVEATREEMEAGLSGHAMGFAFKSGKCLLADPLEADAGKLDTYVLQEKVLKGVYKSDEGKATVAFCKAGCCKAEIDSGRHDCVVVMNRPDVGKVFEHAANGKRVPRSSVTVDPDVWSGFVLLLER